ncbi:MAG: imidazoleglycerol-phosphate dehydratase HisB [Deltaproteobacteria bacterium]|nr:imidazoleglycerol-phosphate dehydratase HisB [Deltaproteobacteria bacterium]
MPRKSIIKRKTTETDISLELNLDGQGRADVKTPIPFLDHMLTLFARHGLFDLKIRAKGDIEVDLHHTVEDVGLCLGEALKKAIKDKSGIRRYGNAHVPMMDSLALVALDLSGRPYLKYDARISRIRTKDAFDPRLVEEFMKAFSNSAGIDLHIRLNYGNDPHHAIEAIFKATGRALSEAVMRDVRIKGVMSTKGRF